MDARYDVVIIGGGAAGLTLALQLRRARPEATVLVLERQSYPVPEIAHKVGESTVEIAAHYLRDVLGLGEHLETAQLNKFGLRVFFSDGDNRDIARRVELGHSVCPPHGVGTYQIDRGRFENALAERLPRHGVELVGSARVEEVDLRPDEEFHRVRLADGRELDARWVVDATGRSSLLKRQLGLAKPAAHRANAAWFRIGRPVDIDDWSQAPAWHARIREGRRRLSTNHLMGAGYWVWLIPLASDALSVGIVTDPRLHPFERLNRFERALEWLDEHEPQCAEVVRGHREDLRDFRVMKDYAYSSEQVFAAERWCLAGEAGVFLDPLYSPGLDLIAISNGLITDLVVRALDGEDVEELAALHNQVFFLISDGWFRVYEEQYPLMGNAQVMTAKVVWDTAAYWAVPGLLYFHDKIRALVDHPRIVTDLARFSAVSESVQRFFREWHALDTSRERDAFVGFYDFDFMPALHLGMTATLPDDALEDQFVANVDLIEQISGQLVAAVVADFVSDAADAAKQEQVRLWRADDDLMRLVRAAAATEHHAGWLALDRLAAVR